MAVRTGTQLKSDMAAIATAVDTAIATPNETNGNAVVSACATLITNARHSRPSIIENPSGGGSHAITGRRGPSYDLEQLADQVRKDALHIMATGATTEAKRWRQLKRTNISNGAWPHLTARPTTD